MSEFISKKRVSGKEAGRSTMTEDGGIASKYSSLIEVVYRNGRFIDAYYFVKEDNAEDFINGKENP